MRFTRLLSVILTAVMLLGLMIQTSAAADQPSSWAKEEVNAAIEEGLVPDYLQKNWTSPVTRGQIAEVFVRLLEKATGKAIDSIMSEKGAKPEAGKFKDTDDKNVYAANALGIINGTSSTTFSPEGTLKRAQIAALINRVAKVVGFDTSGYRHTFTDITGNYSWVDTELGWASTVGIINGVSATRFNPDGDLTTEQALLITHRALQNMVMESSPGKDSSFEVHFIDVKEADSALVICDGKTMLIDGGNPSDSSLIYTYLKDHSITHLDYIVCTHPHADHVGGLPGALNYATAGVAFAPVTSSELNSFGDFIRYLEKQGVSITVPKPGLVFTLGSAKVQVVGPVNKSENVNDMSIVLRVLYGNTSFLFTGDAESLEEFDIINSGYDIQSNVLKVGHHGSSSSSTEEFLNAVSPEFAVISAGAGNVYGHPEEKVLNALESKGIKIYRTDHNGDIICKSNGDSISFTVEKDEVQQLIPTADTDGEAGSRQTQDDTSVNLSKVTYILNKNTGVFHNPLCHSVGRMKESNKVYFTGTRDEAIAQGYRPCGNCNP